MPALAARRKASALVSARCESGQGAGDVLVAAEKQDCRDSFNPIGARPLIAVDRLLFTPIAVTPARLLARAKSGSLVESAARATEQASGQVAVDCSLSIKPPLCARTLESVGFVPQQQRQPGSIQVPRLLFGA